MKYINKRLTVEKVNFQRIAKKFGTPFYCYSYSKLRENVTSPNGTTQAALNILMDKKNGWHGIIKNAVFAAYKRSKILAKN